MNTVAGPFPTTTNTGMNTPTSLLNELAALPSASTSAFQLASRVAPRLIESEAPPALFSQNLASSREAAIRLNGYWSHRSLFLGSMSWMPLRESGLLQEQQQRVMRMVLQRSSNPQDKKTLPPLLMVRARLLNESNLQSHAQALFISLHQAIHQKASSIDIAMQLEEGSSLSKGSILEFLDMAAKLINGSMPFQVGKVHLATTLGCTSMGGATISSLCLQKVLLSGLAQDCIITTAPSQSDLARKMVLHNVPVWESEVTAVPAVVIPRNTLGANILGKIQKPEAALSLGGMPSREEAKTLPATKRSRKATPSIPVAKDTTKTNHVGTGFATEESLDSIYTLQKEAGGKGMDLPAIPTKRGPKTEEEKRKRNAIYSRRKYVRKKIEFQVLEKEGVRLQSQNAALLKEQEQLKQALAQVQKMAADIDSGRMAMTSTAAGNLTTPLGMRGFVNRASAPTIATNLMYPSSLHRHAAILQQLGGNGIPMPPNSNL